MNLRRLEIFVAVAEELHFNRAAQRLHMAQPPLSQQIRKLEQECKVDLFVRNSRNVQLTAEGRVLLDHARKVLAQQATLVAALQHARTGEAGHFRLSFVSSAALSDVPTLVRHIRTTWPAIELELVEATTGAQIEMLKEGRLDAGIAREVRAGDGLTARHLRDEPLLLAVPSGHHLAAHGAAQLADLRGEKFIAFPRIQVSRLFDHIATLLNRAAVDFDIAQEAVQFPTILGLVAAGVGIAIAPDSMRALAIDGVHYLRLTDPTAVSKISLITNPELEDYPLTKRIVEAAVHTLGQQVE